MIVTHEGIDECTLCGQECYVGGPCHCYDDIDADETGPEDGEF